ncbi:hypothetical protein IGI04_020744, partial [Brassica rapa subsp. trilocularis]
RSTTTVSPTPASHRPLIRRRLLSQISGPSPPLQMKKKKPKNSPTKSTSKSSSPTKSKPVTIDLPINETKIVSDAQIGSPADTVAQQLKDSLDLASVLKDIPTCEKVIAVEQADPSPARDEINSPTLELSVVGQNRCSSVEVSDDATVSIDKSSSDVGVQIAAADAKVDTLSSPAAVVDPPPSTGAAAAVNCPKKQKNESTGRKTRRGRSKDKQAWREVDKTKADNSLSSQSQASLTVPVRSEIVQAELHKSQLGTAKDKVVGESSNTPFYLLPVRARSRSGASGSSRSDVQPDSSDVESSDSDLEEGELKIEHQLALLRGWKLQTLSSLCRIPSGH